MEELILSMMVLLGTVGYMSAAFILVVGTAAVFKLLMKLVGKKDD